MGGLDPAKLLVILVLALILLGPERLPRAARQLGSFWRDLSRLRQRLEEEVREAVPDLDLPELPVIRRGGLSGYITGMMAGSGGTQTGDDEDESPSEAVGAGVSPPSGPVAVPAGWQAHGAEEWASGSSLSPLPSAVGEGGGLVADIRLDLSDPSWN